MLEHLISWIAQAGSRVLERLPAETPVNEDTGQAAAGLDALRSAFRNRAFTGDL